MEFPDAPDYPTTSYPRPQPGTGKVALITGGSAGIGKAAAQALLRDGWTVTIAARNETTLAATAEALGCHYWPVDISDEASIRRLRDQFDRLDLLVNNAGMALGLDSVADGDHDDWTRMYEVNVLGTLRVTQQFLALLDHPGGQIITIGSVAGRYPYRGGAGYNAAKHALGAMMKVLRLETADSPLRVTQIDPGRVHTAFSAVRFAGDQDKAEAVYADNVSLTADDVGEAIRWVASLPEHVNIDDIQLTPVHQVFS
ncbi:SDR family NAD(P)-dependent oxidoreductase [Corynebacterium choanae]|uniref:Serine 3-dehydrogenase n=1 Tax=Corynebacterium choanae TaxID=1862358 RepID=A0A3G6J9J6_9CORY|nr:SDR family NAD(P)-dependent oxidoreductase [Corynebacterium choanae]AZA14666.1 Serine 3-dehydrogenase [Corynebacterium choanae]